MMTLRCRSGLPRLPALFWAAGVALLGLIGRDTVGKPTQAPEPAEGEAVQAPPGQSPAAVGESPPCDDREELILDSTWAEGADADPEPLVPPLAFLEPSPVETTFPRLCDNPAFWKTYRSRSGSNCVEDFFEELLSVPEGMLLCATGSLQEALRPNGEFVRWVKGDPCPISDRFLEFSREARQDGIFTTFLGNLAARENRYFAGFANSELYTHEFEDGTGEIEQDDLMRKQRKILWDAFRRTYVESYRAKAENTIQNESLEVHSWMGRDFIVLPPMIAGYVYFRGLEKDFSVGPTRLTISFEPLREWLSGDDVWGAVDFECKVEGFPIGLVVSIGLHEDELGLDFIGLGTSVGIAKKAVKLQHPRPDDDD